MYVDPRKSSMDPLLVFVSLFKTYPSSSSFNLIEILTLRKRERERERKAAICSSELQDVTTKSVAKVGGGDGGGGGGHQDARGGGRGRYLSN